MFGISEARAQMIARDVADRRIREQMIARDVADRRIREHRDSYTRISANNRVAIDHISDRVERLSIRIDEIQNRIADLECAHDPEAFRSEDV